SRALCRTQMTRLSVSRLARANRRRWRRRYTVIRLCANYRIAGPPIGRGFTMKATRRIDQFNPRWRTNHADDAQIHGSGRNVEPGNQGWFAEENLGISDGKAKAGSRLLWSSGGQARRNDLLRHGRVIQNCRNLRGAVLELGRGG